MGRMDGSVALITGGAEGFGAAIGKLIFSDGDSVMLADVQLAKAQALAAQLGERAASVELDVRDFKQA